MNKIELAIELTCEIGESLTSGEITWDEYQTAKSAVEGIAGIDIVDDISDIANLTDAEVNMLLDYIEQS